ncbi:uncharacterized protein LOC135946437 [Cloeon dipterum]|uniref:uncharacterized protein LOC135946437 n=1 Tax=Cloeon dipterum TaxID=197152 RepID=UPI00321F66FE
MKFFLILFMAIIMVGCEESATELATNDTDPDSDPQAVPSAAAPVAQEKCSPSGFRCLGNIIYSQCGKGFGKNVLFCRKGRICDDTGLEVCIPKPPPCEEEGAFMMPGYCNLYYMCIVTGDSLKQFVGSCEPGFEFSLTTGKCVYPAEAGCSIQREITPPPVVTKPQLEITQPPTAQKEDIFKCRNPGVFADPASCRHFFVCSKGWMLIFGNQLSPTRMTCPNWLPYFNAEKGVCWMYNTYCSQI